MIFKTHKLGLKDDNQKELKSLKMVEAETTISKKEETADSDEKKGVADVGEKSGKDSEDKIDQKEKETEVKDKGDEEKVPAVPSEIKPKVCF